MIVVANLALAWTIGRASGIAALLCASGAISLGLLMGIAPVALRPRRLEVRAAHEALSLATFALLALHGLALYFDPMLHPAGVPGVLVPFAGPYRPFATALGQIAAYGMLGLGATFYVRRHLGVVRWKRAHRWISVFWVLGVGHGVLVGSDGDTAWFVAIVALPAAAAAALLVHRLRTTATAGGAADQGTQGTLSGKAASSGQDHPSAAAHVSSSPTSSSSKASAPVGSAQS